MTAAVPYATTAELPAEVQGALPEAAQVLWLRVANSALAAGEPEPSAMAIAWSGVRNAGYAKADGAQWSRARKRRDGDRVSFVGAVTKLDGTDDEVTVSGWASVAMDAEGRLIVDHDNEIIPVPVLKAAAADFLARSREFNAVDHYSQPCGELLESVVMDPATRVAMGLDGTGVTGWWVSAKIRGPAAKRVRSGELREFSIEATALKRRNADNTVTFLGLTVDRVTLVDAGAGIGVRIEAVKARQKVAKNMDAILAKLAGVLSPEEMAVLTAALAKPAAAPEMETELAAAKKRADDAEAALKQRDAEAAMTPEQREEAALKALHPSVREIVLKSRADAKAAQARADRLEAEAVAKRYGDEAAALKALPGASVEEVADMLRAVDSITAKSRSDKPIGELIRGVLKLQAAEIAKHLTVAGRNSAPDASSPEAQIEALAQKLAATDPEIQKLPAAKRLATARTRVYDAHPELRAAVGN